MRISGYIESEAREEKPKPHGKQRNLRKYIMKVSTYLSGITAAYNAFVSEAIEDAIESSTKASWGGSGYSVELFANGTYRVLWDNQIGNLYDSPGAIIKIPPCSDEEWGESDIDRFYGNAIEKLGIVFQEWKKEHLEHNAN